MTNTGPAMEVTEERGTEEIDPVNMGADVDATRQTPAEVIPDGGTLTCTCLAWPV